MQTVLVISKDGAVRTDDSFRQYSSAKVGPVFRGEERIFRFDSDSDEFEELTVTASGRGVHRKYSSKWSAVDRFGVLPSR